MRSSGSSPSRPGRHQIQRRRSGRGRLWSTAARSAASAIRAMSNSASKARPDLWRDRRDGSLTQGGYSDHVVVREEFVLKLPDSLDISRAAPLLCAGITTYSPLKKYRVGPGQRVGVAGLGGLGTWASSSPAALGAHVTMITTSPARATTRGRSAPTKCSFRRTPRRWRRPEPSTSSSTPSRWPRRQSLPEPAGAQRQHGAGRRDRAAAASTAACWRCATARWPVP